MSSLSSNYSILMLQERDWLMWLSSVGAREGAELSGSRRRHLDQPRRRLSADCTQQSAGAGHQAEGWVPGQVTRQVEPGHDWDRGMFITAQEMRSSCMPYQTVNGSKGGINSLWRYSADTVWRWTLNEISLYCFEQMVEVRT